MNDEIIFSDGKYYPSTPGALTDEEIERLMMEDYKRINGLSDEDVEDLYIVRGMGTMDDENGNIYEPYAVARDLSKNKEPEVEYEDEIVFSDGKYYPSRPGALTDEEIEALMMEDYKRINGLSDEDVADLHIVRGMGAMDDENGNIYEPYAVARRVPKKVEQEEIVFSGGKYYPSRPGALTDEEIERLMMEDYQRMNGLSDEDVADLHIVRGMGAMDDENGNIYEPYAVARNVPTKEEIVSETKEEEKTAIKSEIEQLRAKREELIEKMSNEDISEEKEDSRIEEIEAKLTELQEEVTRLVNEYEENITKINSLLTDIQEALDSDDTSKLKEINDQIADIRDQNNKLKNSIKNTNDSLKSLQAEKEGIEAETLAKEELTPEEYQEITNSLSNKETLRKILKQKGALDIYRKKVNDRTPEEQEQLISALREAYEEVEKAKLENRDASVLDLVQALYNIEDEMKREEPAKTLTLTPEEMERTAENANGMPAAVVNRENNEPDYEPEAAPEDMREVMEAQEFEDEIVFDGGKYYPSTPGELSDEEIEHLMMEDYKRNNGLSDEDVADLHIVRGMGAMDDENGNIYEPYAVARRVPKKVEQEEITPPIPPVPPTPDNEDNGNQEDEDNSDKKDEPEDLGRDIHYQEVIYEITKDLDIGNKDVKRYKASNIRVWQSFKDELHSGRVEYNILHSLGSVFRVAGMTIAKYTSKLLLTGRGKEVVETMKERLENLSEAKLQVLYDDYVGNAAMQNMNSTINDLIMDRLKRWILEKVRAINEEITELYDRLFAILGERDAIDSGIDKDLEADLLNRRKELTHQGAEVVLRITELRAQAEKWLGRTGLHGMEETFKAVRTKMNYVGLRWAKTNKFDNDLQEKLAKFGGQFKRGVARGDDEDILEGFIGEESLYAENTEINESILGQRSVGKKYAMQMFGEFDYRDDPFMKDLFTTIALTTATISAINAIRVHQIEAHKVLEAERQKADKYNGAMDTIKGKAEEQLDLTDKYQRGIESQVHQDVVSVSDQLERKALDMTNWRFGNKYKPLDDGHHEFYNGFYDDVSSRLGRISSRRASGAIDSQQAMREIIEVGKSSQDTLTEVSRNCLEVLIPYAKNHPEFDLHGVQQALEYVVNHPNDVTEMYNAIGKSLELSQDIIDTIQYIEPLMSLPSDMFSTLMAAAGSTALVHRIYNEMRNKGYRAGKYDDSITSVMRDRNYGEYTEEKKKLEEKLKEAQEEKDEIDDMFDEELEDEEEKDNKHGRGR